MFLDRPAPGIAATLQADRVLCLGSALAASLLAHMLLLSWPMPISSARDGDFARAAGSGLRVSLNLIAAAHAAPAQEIAAPAAPPDSERPLDSAPLEPAARAVASALVAGDEAAPRAPESRDAIPLIGYHAANSLSRMPEAVGQFDIQPPAGGDTGLGGKMTIRIWISEKGGIDSMRVLDSGLPVAYATAALAAFEKMKFEPGEINRQPVRSWVDVVIEYADFRSPTAQ